MPQTNLQTLLATLSPSLDTKEMVFCCLGGFPDLSELPSPPFAFIKEEEGWTVILEKDMADTLGWIYEGIFCRITLKVHSSLEAVGLTAVVATELTKQNISANVVAAAFHDHVFVPAERASDALICLESVQAQSDSLLID